MTAKLLDGEVLAAKIREELREEIKNLISVGKLPHLTAIQVGENPASRVYINQQRKSCEEMNIEYELRELSANITKEELVDLVHSLNKDSRVTGIILEMPLPSHLNAREIQTQISPDKDVEGVHPFNMGRLVYATHFIGPCTALGAVELLKSAGIPLKGKEAVVVGHSEIVGKPLALLLLQSLTESPTVTVCHIATRDLAFHTRRADILIVAVGKPNLITADMIKEGTMVVDIGINRIPVRDAQGNPVLDERGKPKMKTVGDVEFDRAKEKCSYITPVPGGVGPMTVAMLLRNLVECAKSSGVKEGGRSNARHQI